jgi:hypothetical protein
MCCDLVELLACGHPGLTIGQEICCFRGHMEKTLGSGAPVNYPTVLYAVSQCEAFPSAKYLFTGTEEICDFCRQYGAGARRIIHRKRGQEPPCALI